MSLTGEHGRFGEDPVIHQLRLLGAHVQLDGAGQIRHIRFAGKSLNDSHVEQFGAIRGVATIDIRDTAISPLGARRLQALLPDTEIQFRE